jgi:hypothetical protein
VEDLQWSGHTIESKLQADQDSQRMQFVLSKERQEADRKKIAAQGEAEAQKILATGLTNQVPIFLKVPLLKGDLGGSPLRKQKINRWSIGCDAFCFAETHPTLGFQSPENSTQTSKPIAPTHPP